MKTFEMDENFSEKTMGILIKLLISQLLIAREYQTYYQCYAKTKFSHLIVKYEKNLICIFMIHFNDNIRNK